MDEKVYIHKLYIYCCCCSWFSSSLLSKIQHTFLHQSSNKSSLKIELKLDFSIHFSKKVFVQTAYFWKSWLNLSASASNFYLYSNVWFGWNFMPYSKNGIIFLTISHTLNARISIK